MGWLDRTAAGQRIRLLVSRTRNPETRAEGIRSLIFFALFYLYLWLYVDLRLIAHVGGWITNFPAFFTGWSFFREFIAYPGGLVHYAASFLSQFFHAGWAGAGVATAHAWATCACTGYVLRRFGTPAGRWLRFVPAILLLATYAQHTYHFITAVAVTVALLFTCLYLKWAAGPEGADRRLRAPVGFVALSLVLYVIGGGAFLLFAALSTMYELLCRRRACGLVYPLAGLVLPYVVGVWGFNARPANAYGNLLPYPWEAFLLQGADKGIVLVYVYYGLIPLLALAGALWRMRPALPVKTRPVRKDVKHREKRPRPRRAALRGALGTTVLLVLAGGSALLVRDDYRRTLLEVDFYSTREMWPRVLQAAHRHPDEVLVLHAVNRALYHTGRLGYDMFVYPQQLDALLLTNRMHISAYWRKIDMYMELGHLNLAENALNECLEYFGEQPFLLQRLALINLAKGRLESGAVYLRALHKNLPYRRWARSYLKRLEDDPQLRTDPRVSRLRSVMVQRDHVAAISPEDILLDPLRANPDNRMAFEYLMALYLLTRKLDLLAEHYPRIDQLGYTEVPRLYEEALLLHVVTTKKAFDLRGRPPSPDLYARFEAFNSVVRRHGNNPKAAFGELAGRYNDSYFFYHLYHVSGTVE